MEHDFADLLRRHIGLDVQSIGLPAVMRAVRERQLACAIGDSDCYLQRVRTDERELQELTEAVIVSETWFFRDPEAFAALARWARDEWLPSHSQGSLRVLSVPCATGEEPYSVAMALLDAGLPSDRFQIDAFDISERALTKARRGLYGSNSFRGGDLSFRTRYFARHAQNQLLADEVRTLVQYKHKNLLPSHAWALTESYDVVFCRNLLIYLEPEAQQKVLQALLQLLAVDGWLFVGPSETGLFLSPPFVSARVPLAFAFRKRAGGRAALVSTPTATLGAPIPGVARAPLRPRPIPAAVAAQPAQTGVDSLPRDGLAQAMQHANAGRLREAETLCLSHLQAAGPSAAAFHLLGLVHEAAGRTEAAVEQHRKALYLESDHREALLHLALLLHARGDVASAERLRRRADRLAPSEGEA